MNINTSPDLISRSTVGITPGYMSGFGNSFASFLLDQPNLVGRDLATATGGNYINVVKAIKWWRVENFEEPRHPKGFPLERLIGDCCPDGIESTAEGVVKTMKKMKMM